MTLEKDGFKVQGSADDVGIRLDYICGQLCDQNPEHLAFEIIVPRHLSNAIRPLLVFKQIRLVWALG